MCFFICGSTVKEIYKNVEKKCYTLNEAIAFLDNLVLLMIQTPKMVGSDFLQINTSSDRVDEE